MMTKETGIIDKCVIALKNNKKEKKNVFLKSQLPKINKNKQITAVATKMSGIKVDAVIEMAVVNDTNNINALNKGNERLLDIRARNS